MIDLSEVTDELTLSYRYAYRKRSPGNNEQLLISVSNDCGENWAVRSSLQGNQLGDESSPAYWEPNNKNDWVTTHVTNITSQYWIDNFRFRFQFNNGGGNNIFIDDINIYADQPSDEPVLNNLLVTNNQVDFNVYPNPAQEIINIDFFLESSNELSFDLINAQGQKVKSNLIKGQAGKNQVLFDLDNLSEGVYYLAGTINGVPLETKKIVVR